MLPYFSHWINAFKGKTSDVVMFEQITDPLRPFSFFFFIYYISYYFCLQSCKSHPQENEKFIQWVSFHAQIAYCLKTEALVVAQSYRSRDANPNVLKGMNTEA